MAAPVVKRVVRGARKAADLTLTQADIKALSEKMNDAAWYAAHREKAWAMYQETPMPTTQDEPWRRTDIRAFDWNGVAHSALNGTNGSSKVPAHLLQPLAGDSHGGQLVIENGVVIDHAVSDEIKAQGVIFTDFLSATRDHADLVQKHLESAVKLDEGKFSMMAAALVDQGVFVYVPAGVKVEQPLHAVTWSDGQAHFSRVLVVAEDGAEVTVVNELSSPATEDQPLHCGTVETIVGNEADVKFISLQTLGENVWHFTHERSVIGKDANLDWIFASLGTRFTKNFTELDLAGQGAFGRMSGFYFAERDQFMDHDTQQNHLAPDTESDLLFKGALVDNSRSVWQGMIYCAKEAQRIDGFQANRNMILSKKARADSIPGLEILADDVACTHAATIGQLEDEHLFYLMSRGIPYDEARRVIVEGFYDPILQRIPFEGVQLRLKAFIREKIE